MDFRHLESFLVLAEELHFGRAAARLHLGQSSLSQQLQRLERRVGVELVERSSHHVRLTDAGQAFRVEARHILDRTSRAVSVAREVAAGRVGTLEVGFNCPAGVRALPRTLARLAAEHPGVTARLTERRSGPQLRAVEAGELDVALAYSTSDPGSALCSRQLLRVPVVAVVSEDHELADRATVTFADLARQRCVLFRRELSPALHDAVLGGGQRAGTALTVVEEVDDTAATGIVLASRPLVGFASAVRATDALARGLRAVPLVDPVPTVELRAVWRADAGPLVAAFLRCLDVEPGPP